MQNFYFKHKRLSIVIISLVMAFIFCIPFTSGFINAGADTTFHMNRIEALAEAIKNKDFYPYIYLNQNYGYGYGTPSFYSQVFLYPFALLRLLNVSIYNTWIISVFFLNFLSSISMCFLTKEITKSDKIYIYLLSSCLYLLNTYNLSETYSRGALGQSLAYIFIPLVMAGINRILFNKEPSWILLSLSFTGLVLSHNISFILMVIVFGIICLINIKKIIKEKRLFPIIKATIFSLLLSSFFILSMYQQLRNGMYYINDLSGIGYGKLSGSSLFELIAFRLNNTNSLGIGLALLVLPLFSLKNKNTLWLTITGYVLLFLSTKYFPWDYIHILDFIQFPNRLVLISISFLTISSIVAIDKINIKNTILISISILMFIVGSYDLIFNSYGTINSSITINQLKYGEDIYPSEYVYYDRNIPELSGMEYLPVNYYDYIDDNYFRYLYTNLNRSIEIECDTYNNLSYSLTLTNEENYVVFPKIFYSGYSVEVYENNDLIETLIPRVSNDGRFVSVDIPSNLQNKDITLVLVYKGTTIQKLSLTISILSFASFVLFRKSKFFS